MNIALIEYGSPILGIVFSPAVEENFYGAIGLGSFKVNGQERTKIFPKKQTQDECHVTLSKSHKSKDDDWFINECKKHFGTVHEVPTGSSLKLCRVAEGKADIYSRLGPTYQWDIAAGQAVVESAGGVVNDLFLVAQYCEQFVNFFKSCVLTYSDVEGANEHERLHNAQSKLTPAFSISIAINSKLLK